MDGLNADRIIKMYKIVFVEYGLMVVQILLQRTSRNSGRGLNTHQAVSLSYKHQSNEQA